MNKKYYIDYRSKFNISDKYYLGNLIISYVYTSFFKDWAVLTESNSNSGSSLNELLFIFSHNTDILKMIDNYKNLLIRDEKIEILLNKNE